VRTVKSEANIQRAVIAYAKAKGVPAIRQHFGRGVSVGWPDVLFLIPGGTPLFIEFKSTTGTPTELQKSKLALLETLGYDAIICRDANAGCATIAHRLATARLPTARRGAFA
jgi:hypothetical protein